MAIDTRRSAYTKTAQARIKMMRRKVGLLRRKVDKAIDAKRISGSEELRIAMQRVEHYLSLAELCVEELKRAEADASVSHRPLVDDAFENLAEAIRKAVSRFP